MTVSCKPGTLISAPLLASLLFFAGAPACHAEKGWIIQQTNSLNGDYTTWITSHSYKMAVPGSDFVIVSHGPKWDRYVFSDKRKICCHTSEADAAKSHAGQTALLQSVLTDSSSKVAWKKAKSSIWKGQRVTIYESTSDPVPRRNRGPIQEVRELWIADDIELPAQIARSYTSVATMPPVNRHPLRLLDIKPDGRIYNKLETSTIRKSDIADTCFALPPKTYRPCGLLEVMMNTDDLGDIIGPGPKPRHDR